MSQSINVNIVPGYFAPAFHLSQYDVGRELVAILVDSAGAYQIPSGATVELLGTKPSGFGFTLEADSVSGNVVTFIATATVTAEHGPVPCEIRVTYNGEILGTTNIVLDIERSPHPEDTTDGDSEEAVNVITALVTQAQAIADSLHALNVAASAVPGGSAPTATYDAETNTITFGIPTRTYSDPDDDGNIVIN